MESPAIPNVVVNCISCWETINYQAKERQERTGWDHVFFVNLLLNSNLWYESETPYICSNVTLTN